MKRSAGATAPWAILLGLFLLIEGTWGLKSPVVFGVFTTNWLHAIIGILLGIAGLIAGMKSGARGWCHFVGWLLLIVGVLFFVPVVNVFVTSLLNLNVYIAGFNIIIGVITIIIARMSHEQVILPDGDRVEGSA